MNRMTGVLGLFIGIFGALAILGVFFKIAKLPHWEVLMAVGFIGEAAAFVVMGVLTLIGGFTAKSAPAAPAGESAVAVAPAGPSGEVLEAASREYRDAMRASAAQFQREIGGMLRQHLQADLGATMGSLSQQVQHLSAEVEALGGELHQARGAIEVMRSTLIRTATGDLPDSAERLGHGMRQLAEGMSGAGHAVDSMHADLQVMARRFQAFNHVRQPGGNGHAAAHVLSEGVPVVTR
jgi:hypothetical protein